MIIGKMIKNGYWINYHRIIGSTIFYHFRLVFSPMRVSSSILKQKTTEVAQPNHYTVGNYPLTDLLKMLGYLLPPSPSPPSPLNKIETHHISYEFNVYPPLILVLKSGIFPKGSISSE